MIVPETRPSYFEQVQGTIWPTSARIFQKRGGPIGGTGGPIGPPVHYLKKA